ncbi:MAG: hypothetical protein KAS71_03475 [Bacteroidales bacterium]|nr:hypothetical protein [Bacteroidales bacterium]
MFKKYITLVISLAFTTLNSVNAQNSNVAQYFDDSNVSIYTRSVKLGYHPIKGETSVSFEKGFGNITALEFGIGLINVSRFSSLERFYDKRDYYFALPATTLQKSFVPNIWIQPKMYLNEYFHRFYFGFFVGLTKLSQELLTDINAVMGYKIRLLPQLSFEFQTGIGRRFFTNTFYLAGVPYEEQLSVVVIPAIFKLGYSL